MAKQPRPTPGHYGGSGFDPLSYSPHPESDLEPRERDSMGKVIAGVIFGAVVWGVSRFMGSDDDE